MSNEQYYTTQRALKGVHGDPLQAYGLIDFCKMGQIGNTSIITDPTKVGVRYLVQMLEDIKGVLDASTEM